MMEKPGFPGAAPPEGLRLRRAEAEDGWPLAELWSYVFPGERSAEDRLRELEEGGTFGGIETAWVAEVAGRRVGALRMYDLELGLFGRTFPTMGLAAVAVEPEHRRRGIGGWMCAEALRIARSEGHVLSALYPYQASFYGRLGYTLAGELHRYRFPASDLPLFEGSDRVARVRTVEDAERLREAYGRTVLKANGLLRRTSTMWSFLDHARNVSFAYRDPQGTVRGYLVIRTPRRRPGRRSRMRIRELVAADTAAYRGLLGWISSQRDQWDEVVYDALPSEGFHRLLPHPRRPGSRSKRGLWFESARLLRGPMLRVLNLEALLDGEGARGSGAVLAVRDEQVPENEGTWQVSDSGVRRMGTAGEGAIPIGIAADLLVSGALPGGPTPPDGWEPALGLRDFRMLDSF